MSNKKQFKNSGFTMIELLIYISLVAVISIIFTSFTADVVKSASRSLVVKEVSQNTRLVLSRIIQEIKTAKSISSVTASEISLISFDNTPFDLGFDSVNDLAYIDVNGGGDVSISNDDVRITALTFEEVSTDVIKITITVEQKNPLASEPRKYKLDLSTIVTVRSDLY